MKWIQVVLKGIGLAVLCGALILACSDDNGTSTTGPQGTWAWEPLGTGVDDRVFALTVFGGELIVGGYFDTAGGIAANNIAAWDDSAWSTLGTGMNQEVSALAVYNGKLIAGGLFTSAGGVGVNYIAAWDGATWAPLGTGLNARVHALVVWDTLLIAGGEFTTAGGNSANRVATWNGTSWSSLGSGTDNTVWALTVYEGRPVAAGRFEKAGGATCNSIAAWNSGSGAWSPFLAGIKQGTDTGSVYALAVHGTRMVAGGYFTEAGSVSARNVASCQTLVWSAMGAGFRAVGGTGDVRALTVFDNKLIAGGYFNRSDSDTLLCIAAWNGSAWTPLGGGITGPYWPHVWAMAEYNGKLYAGGRFDMAGADSARSIAAWSLTQP